MLSRSAHRVDRWPGWTSACQVSVRFPISTRPASPYVPAPSEWSKRRTSGLVSQGLEDLPGLFAERHDRAGRGRRDLRPNAVRMLLTASCTSAFVRRSCRKRCDWQSTTSVNHVASGETPSGSRTRPTTARPDVPLPAGATRPQSSGPVQRAGVNAEHQQVGRKRSGRSRRARRCRAAEGEPPLRHRRMLVDAATGITRRRAGVHPGSGTASGRMRPW
jgi:hypothetical protein